MSTTVSPALEELEAAVGSEALLTSDEQLPTRRSRRAATA
jgi:hypothetical protein